MTVTKKRSNIELNELNSVKKIKKEVDIADTAPKQKSFNKFSKDKKFEKDGKFGNNFRKGEKFNKFSKGGKFNNSKFSNGKAEWKTNKPYIKSENADTATTENEKPDWKKMKQEKKDLKLKRKQTKTKDLFELTVQAKQIYEKLKCRTTPNREELAKELHKLIGVGGNYIKLVLAHDTARVVQCMLKQAPADIKNEITQELIPNVVQMATSKYARFCVSRMLKYGSNGMRERIINAMLGNVIKLVNNNMSSNLIDAAYLTWATNKQKIHLKQEFYGDLYKTSKDDSVRSLADTWKDSENLKTAILGSVKIHLEHAVNKQMVDNSLVHSVLLEYINECSEENRNEMVISFSSLLPTICSTKDGARAACLIFWHSGNKERRVILKSLKDHVVKLCVHEHGHSFVLTLLTTLDDTVMMKKVILDIILKDIDCIISNEWGRKIIEWIVCPGDKTYFHPKFIEIIEEGLKHCKKDVEVKRKEILEVMEVPLCNAIAGNGKLWLQGGHTAQATVAILKISQGEHSRDAFNSLAKVICASNWEILPYEEHEIKEGEHIDLETNKIKKKKKNPFEKEKKNAEPICGIEDAGLHVALKKLIKNDSEKLKTENPTFGESIVKEITDDTLEKWLPLNRGCFLLITIFENSSLEIQNRMKTLIKKFKNILDENKHAGSKILKQKLEL